MKKISTTFTIKICRTPNYSGNEQFVDQNSQVYMNGSGTVSSPDNSMIQHSVSSSPNSATNCLPTASASREMGSDHSQHSFQDDQDNANKQPAGDKAFVCPVCSKGLARKDKLVIHMRIHTGIFFFFIKDFITNAVNILIFFIHF